jgi:hypothetical protein
MSPDVWPWHRPYIVTTGLLLAAFVAALLALAWNAETGRLPLAAAGALALVPPATVAAQFAAAWRLIAGQDEWVRALTAKRMIAAAGLTVTLAVGWSMAEEYVGLPHAPAWLLYPFFWGAFGFVTPFIRDSRP